MVDPNQHPESSSEPNINTAISPTLFGRIFASITDLTTDYGVPLTLGQSRLSISASDEYGPHRLIGEVASFVEPSSNLRISVAKFNDEGMDIARVDPDMIGQPVAEVTFTNQERIGDILPSSTNILSGSIIPVRFLELGPGGRDELAVAYQIQCEANEPDSDDWHRAYDAAGHVGVSWAFQDASSPEKVGVEQCYTGLVNSAHTQDIARALRQLRTGRPRPVNR